MSGGQYEHASRALAKIGQLLGGRLKRDPDERGALYGLQASEPA